MAKNSEKKQPKEAVPAAPASQAENASMPANKLEDVKQQLSATGLKDNGFWWQQMLEEQKASAKEQNSFRRGRIWS